MGIAIVAGGMFALNYRAVAQAPYQPAYNGSFIDSRFVPASYTDLGTLFGIPKDTTFTGMIGLPTLTGNVTFKSQGSTTGVVQPASSSGAGIYVEKIRLGDITVSGTVGTDVITLFGFGRVQ